LFYLLLFLTTINRDPVALVHDMRNGIFIADLAFQIPRWFGLQKSGSSRHPYSQLSLVFFFF